MNRSQATFSWHQGLALLGCATALLTLTSCFSPNYGDGGFACSKGGSCPGGYLCVSEGTNKVCRPTGGQRDGGKTPDGKPRIDGLKVDGPMPDKSGKDGSGADLKKPDSQKPDLPPPPVCGYDDKIVAGLQGSPLAFGHAIDNAGVPHVVYTDSNNSVTHVFRLGAANTWKPDPIPTIPGVNRVAFAIDGTDRLHVVYRGLNAQNRPFHVFRDASGAWTTPVPVMDPTLPFDGLGSTLDLGAYGPWVYLGADRNLGGSSTDAYFIRFDQQSSKMKYNYTVVFPSTTSGFPFAESRVGVGPGFAAATICAGSKWNVVDVQNTGTATPPHTTTAISETNSSSPMVVAVDGQGNVHMAYIKDGSNYRGPITYLVWNGKSGDPPVINQVAALAAKLGTASLALDATGTPHIFYEGLNNILWTTRSSSGTWSLNPVQISPVGSGEEPIYTRILAAKNKTVHFTYSKNGVLFHSCRPLP
jgi:hypothetical protein